MPADPDGGATWDADDAGADLRSVADPGGEAEQVLATAHGASGDVLEPEPEPEPEPAGPSPAEVAHLLVLAEIAAGKYVRLDRKAIEKAAVEQAVENELARLRGHLG